MGDNRLMRLCYYYREKLATMMTGAWKDGGLCLGKVARVRS